MLPHRPPSRFLLASVLVLLAGCASRPPEPVGPRTAEPTTMHVASSRYLQAFDAARTELRDRGFVLDRIDAASGVITTRPKRSAGALVPWDPTQSKLVQERDELLNPTQRRIRVSFAPLSGGRPSDDPNAPMEARVRVDLDRIYRPNWRPSPVSVRLSSFARDPDRISRGVGRTDAIPQGRDPHLEERVAQSIRKRLDRIAAKSSTK